MCDGNRKIAEFPCQLKEAGDLFLCFGSVEAEVEYGQGHFEENLWTLQEEHVPHSQHCIEG